MMSSNGNDDSGVQHIDEQIESFKKQLNSFSKSYYKFSAELPNFMFKDKMIQQDMLNDVYEQSSLLEGLLREIMEEELNAVTFRQIFYHHQQHNHKSSSNSKQQPDEEEEEEDW